MDDRALGGAVAIVLAAGKSTRMKSDLPKVLHDVCGRPMLAYVIDACRLAGVERLLVVVGQGKEAVVQRFGDASDITWIHQAEQKGTGHAVLCCRDALEGFEGNVLVIAGDMPLVRRETLSELLEARATGADAVAMATTVLDDPTGYGRIIRDEAGWLQAIIEERDCTPEQRNIREVNPSYYCFDGQCVFEALEQVEANPASGEQYVTDAVRVLREAGRGVSATVSLPAEDATGVNSRLDLAWVGRLMQDRIQLALMNEGVTIVDPDNTWIEADVTIGCDTTIQPFTVVRAGASIGARCQLGPFAVVGSGEVLQDGAVVGQSTCVGADAS